MALDTSELKDHTVAELRQIARERGIKRYSKMKKAELVKALQRDGAEDVSAVSDWQAAGETTPRVSTEDIGDWTDTRESMSVPNGNGEGQQYSTFDHDEIRAWAEDRNAAPAINDENGEPRQLSALCFRFPWSMSDSMRLIDWPTWLRTFDDLRLRFIYLIARDGSQTNDFELQRR